MRYRSLKFIAPVILLSLLAVACSENPSGNDTINISRHWKFKQGDNKEWSQPSYDDSQWKEITTDFPWASQGYESYVGFAWYRLKIMIPSSLKKKSFYHDSLQFSLGRILDMDQFYLNGKLVGQNGRSMDQSPGEFNKDNPSYAFRDYRLPVNDPNIKWDQYNIIAIRVFDIRGRGGIFNPLASISMVDIKDSIDADLNSSPFEIVSNIYFKQIQINNRMKDLNISGDLSIRVIKQITNEEIYSRKDKISIRAGDYFNEKYSFSAPSDQSYEITYTFKPDNGVDNIVFKQIAPYIMTPAASDTPSINAPALFGAGTGHPFLYKIPASGMTPIHYSVENLPAGLSLDSNSGIITGVLNKGGDYHVLLKATNSVGADSSKFLIRIGGGIALTPPLGWNSWNCWGLSANDEKIKNAANAMKSTGLINYGWTNINIDDGWEAEKRTSKGDIQSNDKFPDMKALTNYVHGVGLKIGLYSSPGPKTCGEYLGTYGHELQDARTWADWGFDYIKYDWCYYYLIAANENSQEELEKPYRVMRNALDKVNRDLVYSLCQYGMGDVWKWGKEVGGNSWRTTEDISDSWTSLKEIGFSQNKSAPYAGPGHWNDEDMLVVGWLGWGPDIRPTHLSADEQYTHISLWSLLSSPLLLGCDLNKLDKFTLNLLTNREVLAIDQDSLGRQAIKIYDKDDIQVWKKEMSGPSLALGFFNLGDTPKEVSLNLQELGLKGEYWVRDVWRQKDLGNWQGPVKFTIPIHGVKLVKLVK